MAKVGLAAIDDAGAPVDQVDGLLVPPVGGVAMVAPATVAEYIGLRPSFAELVDLGGAAGAGMVWRAAAAIAAGMCSTCLCVTAARRERRPSRSQAAASGDGSTRPPSRDRSPSAEFEAPYGTMGANAAYAQIAMRYHHEYALTAEQRAKVAVDQRANARVNPAALFHDQPITVDDVLASEVIAPLHLLEIVMPAAGAAAVVVTAADRATDGPHPPVWLLGAGERVTHTSLPWAVSLTHTPVAAAASAAFAMAEVKPGDIGLASLYDCYTIAMLLTLEDAGFCAKGGAGAFVESHDLRWSGDFPLNTHGGQLSFGQPGIAGDEPRHRSRPPAPGPSQWTPGPRPRARLRQRQRRAHVRTSRLRVRSLTMSTLNPVAIASDRIYDEVLRKRYFRGIQFTDPLGDPGWFRPDSAVWYVHSHTTSMALGLMASIVIESLHPDFAYAGYEHSRAMRKENGVFLGLDPEGSITRAGHSFGFFLAVALGSAPAAEKACAAVNGLHSTIEGVRPDGKPYSAMDPETMRWAYCTVVWGIANGHQRFHPKPLQGTDLDQYYREFTRVGEALYGSDLPATKDEVDQYLLDSAPLCSVTLGSAEMAEQFNPRRALLPLKPAMSLAQWTLLDMQPDWAKFLLRVPPTRKPEARARRAAVRSAEERVGVASTRRWRPAASANGRLSPKSRELSPTLLKLMNARGTMDAKMNRGIAEAAAKLHKVTKVEADAP
ncbi:MAG: oxygenase MpaB family protein [Acidimicrobiales bacterium]